MNKREYTKIVKSFTVDQMRAFKIATSGADTFITGGGGVGKSFLLKAIKYKLESEGKNVIVCAPTGVAALKVGGSTIHRTFRLPVGCCITEKTKKIVVHTSKALNIADVVIVDEISMCRIDMFDSICSTLNKILERDHHYIQLIVMGDFCQLPPVIEKESERQKLNDFYGFEVGEGYAFYSPEWKKRQFVPVMLDEVVRQKNKEFADNLNKLRMCDTSGIDYFNKNSAAHPIPEAISMYPYNRQVAAANAKALAELQPPEYIISSVTDSTKNYNSPEPYIEKEDRFKVKVGARIMFTMNDNGEENVNVVKFDNSVTAATNKIDEPGTTENPKTKKKSRRKKPLFVNGSMGEIWKVELDPNNNYMNDVVRVVLDNGGGTIEVKRQTIPIYDYEQKENGRTRRITVGHIYKFPFCLAYAMTIHKSQGQTYEAVNIDPECYNSGQLYVALSRCTDISHVYLAAELRPEFAVLDKHIKSFYDSVKEVADKNKAYVDSSDKIDKNTLETL